MAGLTLLVDGPSLIYRSHFALPDSIRSSDGQVVSAAYGFLSMLERLISDLRPTHVGVGLDGDWRPAWRVDLLPEYKAHRVATEEDPVEDTIERQTEIVVRLLGLARVKAVGSSECEAEDVLATLASRTKGKIAVVSGDRDLFQMVRDPNVWVLYPKRGVSDLAHIDEAEITKRYGIDGRSYGDFAILRGDPSDGLPGVPGIGEKSAAALINKHGTLDGVLRASGGAKSGPLAKVAANRDYVIAATKVVRLKADCRIGEHDLALGGKPSPTLKKIALQLGLNGPVNRLLATLEKL
jgi:5'-3' exonuclease